MIIWVNIMILSEIYNKQWKLSPKLEIRKIRLANITKVEQEFLVNFVAVGFHDEKEEEAIISCSLQKYIIGLTKNADFILESVLISDGLPKENGFILQVDGYIPTSAKYGRKLCKSRQKLTVEQKEKLVERLKNVRENKNARN